MKPSPSSCCSCSDDASFSRSQERDRGATDFRLQRELPPLIGVVVLFTLGMAFEAPLHDTFYSIGAYAVFLPAYLLGGWNILLAAGRSLLKGKAFDENFLMAVATLGAIAIQQLPEAVGVMLFFKIGELFQEMAVSNSRRSIAALLAVRPDVARLQTESGLQTVAPESVRVGDVVLVKPGEKVPLDGEILEGSSQLDTSALTGESVPRSVREGDSVAAGTIAQTGRLIVRVTKRFEESSVAKILDLVENASAKKAATQKFIRRFALRYTPVVAIASLAVALLPPLFVPGATYGEWIYRALVLLVISCPCGLVISIPLSYFGGIGGAAKRGILVKGSVFLDVLAAVKTIAFDKTGTLTQGVFKVSQIVPHNGFRSDELLRLAALAESNSNHPIAKSICEAYGRPIDASAISEYVEIPACGVRAKIGNTSIVAGSDRLLRQQNIACDAGRVEGTVVRIAVDRRYAGYITIADELKPDAAIAVRSLEGLNIEPIVMLTGDSRAVARRVAENLGVRKYEAELLPEEKVGAIEALLHNVERHDKVAFVGDGINDAPVLARADVGIAMGGLGSDAAIETADVVLMADDPSKVAEAIRIARKTRRIVWQNIAMAMSVKGLFIALGVVGVATMWEAVFADVGVALLAVFNATRVLR